MGQGGDDRERSLTPSLRRGAAVDVALVAAVHAAACVAVLSLGFDHVSDDDYARVTIAQSFAHAPKLDPTGTSWLPFPFWLLGAALAVFGRSLGVARVASIVIASLAATLPYLALRMTGSSRPRAALALVFALVSPWSLWLGAATVPESMTASLTAAAVIALGARSDGETRVGPRARIGFALALAGACLSRYEAWPIAAALALVLGLRALKTHKNRDFVVVTILAIGPLAWMAWNVHAHQDPLHFFKRVSSFKRALGESPESTTSALLLFPRLFVTMRPEVTAAAAGALLAAHRITDARDALLRRWLVPLGCVLAQLAFLAYGNARDGAPAHHSERALLGAVVITAMFAADVLAAAWTEALERARPVALGAAALLTATWLAMVANDLTQPPGTGAADDRRAQIDTGNALRLEGAENLELTPCAYEHFALIAAFRAPEHVVKRPSSGLPVSASCPAVERR